MPIDNDGRIYGNWSLGDDDYCDTCGSSYNEVSFSDWGDGETYSLNTSIGCYSGESYEIDQLEKLFKDIEGFELYSDSMRFSIMNVIGEYLAKYEK